MKRSELLSLAAKAGVKGRSRMNKGQLMEALLVLSRAVEPVSEQVPASAAPPEPGAWPPPVHREQAPVLPPLLGINRLVLLPQGPRIAFAYWELDREVGPEGIVLRILSAQTGARIAVYEIAGRTGSYYLRFEESGLEIEGLLGDRVGGEFHLILRSNRIRLPDDSPSDELPDLWMTRRKDYEEIFRLSMGGSGITEPAWTHEEYRSGYPVFSWPGERKKGLS